MTTLDSKAKKNRLTRGEDGITCTFWNGPAGLLVVGKNKADCRRQATAKMGEWDTEVWSTPLSIYNDLTGVTAERTTQEGQYADQGQGHRGW